jgi:hypothetical protein
LEKQDENRYELYNFNSKVVYPETDIANIFFVKFRFFILSVSEEKQNLQTDP